MRRKPGTILPIELSVLETAVALSRAGVEEFHGFELAKRLRDGDGQRTLTAHGTLYKALTRMEKAGLLESAWEDPDVAVHEGRPRRRLYALTSKGRAALTQVASKPTQPTNLNPRWSEP